VSRKSHISEEFLDHIDQLSGLAVTLEQQEENYREAIDNLEDSDQGKDAERTFNQVSSLLESVFDELDALDSLIEYSEMRATVSKGSKKGYFDLEDWLEDTEDGRYDSIDSWKEAVIFADVYDDELEVQEEKLSIAGTLIEYSDAVVRAYQKLDRQFDWLIDNEEEARENVETNDLGLYETEPPIYQLLNTEYNDRASKLNTEV
jgi:hypothetical protein